ncbi:hypothetical protein ABZV58_29880 [Nocardia sp. NPDC004654]|uniref:hypothetical protein n=1 Tax=Nocardia sp. NPDC004654 TaxID=3154776 RepID=UPI0033ADD612
MTFVTIRRHNLEKFSENSDLCRREVDGRAMFRSASYLSYYSQGGSCSMGRAIVTAASEGVWARAVRRADRSDRDAARKCRRDTRSDQPLPSPQVRRSLGDHDY